MTGDTRVPLAEAALQLKRTYHQVLALVLRGDLAGGRDRFGHWYVKAAALRRLRAARGSKAGQPIARTSHTGGGPNA